MKQLAFQHALPAVIELMDSHLGGWRFGRALHQGNSIRCHLFLCMKVEMLALNAENQVSVPQQKLTEAVSNADEYLAIIANLNVYYAELAKYFQNLLKILRVNKQAIENPDQFLVAQAKGLNNNFIKDIYYGMAKAYGVSPDAMPELLNPIALLSSQPATNVALPQAADSVPITSLPTPSAPPVEALNNLCIDHEASQLCGELVYRVAAELYTTPPHLKSSALFIASFPIQPGMAFPYTESVPLVPAKPKSQLSPSTSSVYPSLSTHTRVQQLLAPDTTLVSSADQSEKDILNLSLLDEATTQEQSAQVRPSIDVFLTSMAKRLQALDRKPAETTIIEAQGLVYTV